MATWWGAHGVPCNASNAATVYAVRRFVSPDGQIETALVAAIRAKITERLM
jgi:hypothetical protein